MRLLVSHPTYAAIICSLTGTDQRGIILAAFGLFCIILCGPGHCFLTAFCLEHFVPSEKQRFDFP
jgi:hypothetical protein